MRQSRIALRPWLDQALILRKPIAIIDGEPVYSFCGAEGEGDGDGDDKSKDDKSSGSGSSGKKDDDDDDDDDKSSEEKPPKDPKEYKAWLKVQELSRENANRRIKNKKLTDDLKAAQDALEKVKQKDMSELEKAQTKATKAEARVADLEARVEDQQVELAFLKYPRDKYDWHDAGAALTLLLSEHRSSLTLNEDGTVDGMQEAIKALAKQHKFLLKVPGSTNNDGDDNNDGRGGSTGGSFGGNGRGGNKSADQLRREKASSRFNF